MRFKFSMPPASVVKKKRISHRGCQLNPGDIVYRRTTYRIADGTPKEKDDKVVFKSVMDAIIHVASTQPLESANYRVIEIPAGEPWDFDGHCIAELACERGL